MKRLLFVLFLLASLFARAQTASFTVSVDTLCQDSCITLINTSTGIIDSIQWVIIGDIATIPRNDTVTVCFLSAGNDTVKLYVYDTGRVDSSLQVLRIKPMPHPIITDTFPCGLKVPDIYLSYKWYWGPGYFDSSTDYFILNSISPSPYYVVVDSNGCLGKSNLGYACVPFAVKQVMSPTHEIAVFPNPTANTLTILSTNQTISQIIITNLVGQIVYIQKYDLEKVQLDVSTLPTGIYFMKVNGSEVGKFLKE